MSATTTNASSDDTLIRDSQISGFAAFKERLSSCCCRFLKRTADYDLSAASKDTEDQKDRPSYISQAVQREKQARNDKLEKIARTLPNGIQGGIRTPSSLTKNPTRPLTTITQATPRSGITIGQAKPPGGTPISKPGISTINRPSPMVSNIRKAPDETSSEESTEEEETSESDDKSSDSERAPPKRAPVKPSPIKRR